MQKYFSVVKFLKKDKSDSIYVKYVGVRKAQMAKNVTYQDIKYVKLCKCNLRLTSDLRKMGHGATWDILVVSYLFKHWAKI